LGDDDDGRAAAGGGSWRIAAACRLTAPATLNARMCHDRRIGHT